LDACTENKLTEQRGIESQCGVEHTAAWHQLWRLAMHWIRRRGLVARRLTCSLGGSAMAI